MWMSSRSPAKGGAVAPGRDAYGWELWNCYQGITDYEIVERDDGFVDPGSALPYFETFNQWPIHERKAILQARGPVLDIGAGAGRVALYLQERSQQVLAIDSSPLAIKVCRERGVKTARILSIDAVSALRRKFGSFVLFGNNFGLFGGVAKARRVLAAMDRISTPDAIVLAATTNPYRTREPAHLSYHQRNRDRGRMAGQIRMRIRYRQFRSDWFDYLLASRDEVHAVVGKTPWVVAEFVESDGPGYVVVLRKR